MSEHPDVMPSHPIVGTTRPSGLTDADIAWHRRMAAVAPAIEAEVAQMLAKEAATVTATPSAAPATFVDVDSGVQLHNPNHYGPGERGGQFAPKGGGGASSTTRSYDAHMAAHTPGGGGSGGVGQHEGHAAAGSGGRGKALPQGVRQQGDPVPYHIARAWGERELQNHSPEGLKAMIALSSPLARHEAAHATAVKAHDATTNEFVLAQSRVVEAHAEFVDAQMHYKNLEHRGAPKEELASAFMSMLEREQQMRHEQRLLDYAQARERHAYGALQKAQFDINRTKAMADRVAHPVARPYTHDHAAIEALTTTKAVEDYLNLHTPGTTFALAGAHVDAAKHVAHEVAELAALHPEAMAQLSRVGITNDPRMARYMTRWRNAENPNHPGFLGSYWWNNPASGKAIIVLAPELMGNPHGAGGTQRIHDKQMATRFRADGNGTATPAGYTMRHEFGHHLDFSLRLGGSSSDGAQAVGYLHGAVHKNTDARKLSTYAETSAYEHWAEAFAGMKYGDEAHQRDPYVQTLRELLDAFG